MLLTEYYRFCLFRAIRGLFYYIKRSRKQCNVTKFYDEDIGNLVTAVSRASLLLIFDRSRI